MIYWERNHQILASNNIKIVCIGERLIKIKREKDMELLYMRMEGFMKDPGRLIKEMEEDLNYLLMAILFRVNIR